MDVEQNPGEESIGPRSSCSDSISAGAVDTGCNVGLGEWSEYECQYLGFTPKSFTNGGYNAVITSLKEGLSTMEAFINEEFGTFISQEKTKQALEKIQSVLVEKLDKRFDQVERYQLRNVFNIPEDLVLPEDSVQMTHPLAPEENQQMEKDMEELRKHILAVRYGNECARQQINEIENLQKHADSTLLYLQQLESSITDAGVLGIKDSLSFVLDKTKELMSAVNGLGDQRRGTTDSNTA
ncbi:protein MIS12 homolog [Crassostrea virginica]